MVAIGDSLTHGVGDETNKEGYVSLVANQIQQATKHPVKTANFGVTGDTSVQITKRVQKQKPLQQQLAKADIVTLTVGGNDLMAVLQNNFFWAESTSDYDWSAKISSEFNHADDAN